MKSFGGVWQRNGIGCWEDCSELLDEVVGDLARQGSRRRAALVAKRRHRQAEADRDRDIVHLAAIQHGIVDSAKVEAAKRDRDIVRLTELLARSAAP